MNTPIVAGDPPDGSSLLGMLEVSLLNLRTCWPHGWPGLPLVFERCLEQLGFNLQPHATGLQAVTRCALEVAEWLEREGRQQSQLGLEPAYHNRLHMADTLVSLTLLLKVQRQLASATSPTTRRHEWLALLAMLAHDLLHDGSVNQYPTQLESRSAKALKPLMQQHGMSRQDQRVVEHLILKTDPQCVRQTHAEVAGRPFVLEDMDCLAVLVQEADIVASTLAVTGTDLTRSLAQEWESDQPAMAKTLLTVEGRLRFLEYGALFSSPASLWMGIQQARQAQIDAIRLGLSARPHSTSESCP